MTITDFLLARIAEDEATARAFTGGYTEPGVYMIGDDLGAGHLAIDPARFLRECEAKRRIVGRAVLWSDGGVGRWDEMAALRDTWTTVLGDLAVVYAEHPDYDPAWGLPRGQNAVSSDLTPTNT